MDYDILKTTAPQMPTSRKGTQFVNFILSKASKDMREPLLPMIFPALSVHLTSVSFTYLDGKQYEMCGQLGHLIGPSGVGKAQLGYLVEQICRDFRKHDDEEMEKLVAWAKQVKAKGAVMWILNDMWWAKFIGDFVEWFCDYDMWSKVQVFGDVHYLGDP